MIQFLLRFLLRGAFRISSTKFGGWFFTTIQPHFDRALLKLSRGRYSIAGIAIPTLLLVTTGRRSGKQRTVPLLYIPSENEGIFYIIGSRGGRKAHAAWFYNIQANASVRVIVGGSTHPYTASVLEEPQRSQVWAHFVEYNRHFEKYQNRIERQIPVVRLEPNNG